MIITLFQELTRGVSKSKGKSIIELRKLCGKHRTVPTAYKLDGVEKEGECAQHNSKTQIWKGRYKGDVVALKILRLPQEDPSIQRIESVSKSRDLRRLLPVVLIGGVAALQGSGVDETTRTQKHHPVLRGIDYTL